MKRNESILNELREMGSHLPGASENVFTVPAGYFASLPERIMERIRAGEELQTLSPLLGGLSKKMDYAIPSGYFEKIQGRLDSPAADSGVPVQEELATLSPLLNGIDRRLPYSVPHDYFENLPVLPESRTKVVSIAQRSWFRYAAAAVVTAIIVTSGFLLLNRKEIDPDVRPIAWMEKKLKKVSTDDINSFVELVEADPATASGSTPPVEINKLLNEVSPEEIQAFLDETEMGEPGLDEDILN